MQLTIDLPENLAVSLNSNRRDLDAIIEEGLRMVRTRSMAGYRDLSDVVEFLATLPEPKEIMELRPTPELQNRIESLLEKNRNEGLNESDEQFWESYEFIEHLVQRAKRAAMKKLGQ